MNQEQEEKTQPEEPPAEEWNEASFRIAFPADESRLPWLGLLLDAFAIVDAGVAKAVDDVQQKEHKPLACGNGCNACCSQTDIPLFPHELVGLYWYSAEKVADDLRPVLKQQLAAHSAGSRCPFLIQGSCVVHPVRPMSCRQFNVFTKPCSEGEDPYYTRREDVLNPLADNTGRSFAAIIPFYNNMQGAASPEAAEASIEAIREQMTNLQEFEWKRLVTVMEQTEKKGG